MSNIMRDYRIDRRLGRCARTGRPFTEDEIFHVVLFEEEESFRREEVSMEGWNGPPEGAFCHFLSKIPPKKVQKRAPLNIQGVLALFRRLGDGELDDRKRAFRYVLALVLLRKRLLQSVRRVALEPVELWELRLVQDDSLHQVAYPRLGLEAMEAVSEELSALLHGAPEESLSENEETLATDDENDLDAEAGSETG